MSPNVRKRRPEDEAENLPATPNPLPIRMGAIGSLPQTGHLDQDVATRKYLGLFDLLQSRALGAYGFDLAHPVRPWEAPFVRAFAEKTDLALHAGTWENHLAHDPGGYVRMPLAGCPHALAAVMAGHVLNASLFGARTFSFSPPVEPSDPVGAAGAELERLLQQLDRQTRGADVDVRLHLINGYNDGFALWRLDDLLDFCAEQGRVFPTIELGFAYATGQCPDDVDGWRELLRRCPEQSLFVYSIGSDVDATGIAWTVFEEAQSPQPNLRTFLEALREEGRRPTVLLQAHHPEFSILEAVDVACQVWDVDVPAFLRTRSQMFPHKPFARLR